MKTKNIKDGAVVPGKLADGAVTSAKLADRAVTAAKLGDVVVHVAYKPLPDATNVVVTAPCAAGERLISGGGSVSASNAPDITFLASNPDTAGGPEGASPIGWTANFNNALGDTGQTNAEAWAVCVK